MTAIAHKHNAWTAQAIDHNDWTELNPIKTQLENPTGPPKNKENGTTAIKRKGYLLALGRES